MDLPQLLLVGLVLLLGVVGVLIPGVPGTWLVWAGLLWWALHVRSAVAWSLLVAATALLLVVQVVKWLLPPRRMHGLGVTARMAAFAGPERYWASCSCRWWGRYRASWAASTSASGSAWGRTARPGRRHGR